MGVRIFIADNNNSVFGHIKLTIKISDIATICTLSTYNYTLTVEI